MLDIRRLRVLHAVSAHGSVTAAAAALGYSGPAVSQQLASLEREVGMRLTERAGRGIALTPAADILVAHTGTVLAQLDAAEADVAALRDQVTGKVRLAAFPSAGAVLMGPAWQALARSSPRVQLSLHEMEPEESLPGLLRGDLDVAVAHEYSVLPRPLDPLIEQRQLLSEPVLAAVPAGSPLAGTATLSAGAVSAAPVSAGTVSAGAVSAGAVSAGAVSAGAVSAGAVSAGAVSAGTVSLEALAGQPFLTPRPGTACAEMTQRACAAAGYVPRVVAHATDFQVLLSLVAAGAGVTLIPRLAARHVPPDVQLLTPEPAITRVIFTVSRRGGDRKPAVRVVLDALQAAAADLPAD